MRSIVKIGAVIALCFSASYARSETADSLLSMSCDNYDIFFRARTGEFWAERPYRETRFPIWKIDEQEAQPAVIGLTKYGKVIAFFNSGHADVVWVNKSGIAIDHCVLNQ